MGKLKELKVLENKLLERTNDIELFLYTQIKKIKQEYQNILIDEKMQLLIQICEGEKLDIELIKNKYINSRELTRYKNDKFDQLPFDNNLLDKIKINNNTYYYENKENGNIYDLESHIVGKFINNSIVLN